MVRKLVLLVALAILVPYVLNQVRRPTRWVGRFFLWAMNLTHGGLVDWGLKHVSIGTDAAILDVGCGGGAAIRKMAAIATDGKVTGVDYSVGSVNAARATNADAVRAGRVEIRPASVSHLPFPDATFDLVTAMETHFYWPDLPGDLREVLRVVKPGGTAMVVAETYAGGGAMDLLQRPAMMALRSTLMTAGQHRAWFVAAGFADVEVDERRGRGWICVTGRRPA